MHATEALLSYTLPFMVKFYIVLYGYGMFCNQMVCFTSPPPTSCVTGYGNVTVLCCSLRQKINLISSRITLGYSAELLGHKHWVDTLIYVHVHGQYDEPHLPKHRRRNQSGWSGHGQTILSQSCDIIVHSTFVWSRSQTKWQGTYVSAACASHTNY